MERSRLHIFLGYVRRMDFRRNEAAPLLDWPGPEDAYAAWQECTRGQLCDYTGISYAKLQGGSGVQWPCNTEAPAGTIRLYTDAVFPTEPNLCETYGRDLLTGATVEPTTYLAMAPGGQAIFKSAPYSPPPKKPSDEFPLRFTTGRTTYHFHTRTKTARSRPLNDAAPESWIELSMADAATWKAHQPSC